MKITVYLIICLLLAGCSQSKSAYETQKDLDAYLGGSGQISLSELTVPEQNFPLVVFEYKLTAQTTPVSGIKQLAKFNTGKVSYWLHFRTTSSQSAQSVFLPGPSPALFSKVDFMVRVKDNSGSTDYHNSNFEEFLSRFSGEFLPDFGGFPEIELKKVPPDTEFEYTMNQEFRQLPFYIPAKLPTGFVRSLVISIDAGNASTRGILTSNLPLNVQNASNVSIVGFLQAKDKGTPANASLLPERSYLSLLNYEISDRDLASFYFPFGEGLTEIPSGNESGIENFKRNFMIPVRDMSESKRKDILTACRTFLKLDNSFFTNLTGLDPQGALDKFSSEFNSVTDFSSYSDPIWDPWFSRNWPELAKLALLLTWAEQEKITGLTAVCKKKESKLHSLTLRTFKNHEEPHSYEISAKEK